MGQPQAPARPSGRGLEGPGRHRRRPSGRAAPARYTSGASAAVVHVLAGVVSLVRADAELPGERQNVVLRRPDERRSPVRDAPATDRLVEHPSTDPRLSLDHQHRVARARDDARRGQAGESGADHDHIGMPGGASLPARGLSATLGAGRSRVERNRAGGDPERRPADQSAPSETSTGGRIASPKPSNASTEHPRAPPQRAQGRYAESAAQPGVGEALCAVELTDAPDENQAPRPTAASAGSTSVPRIGHPVRLLSGDLVLAVATRPRDRFRRDARTPRTIATTIRQSPAPRPADERFARKR